MKKELSILNYNTCFGLKANTPWSGYTATWKVMHGRKDPVEILKKADFCDIYREVKVRNIDVVILNEVLDGLQTPEIINNLKKLGFTCFHIGNSGHHDKPLCVSTLVATKQRSISLENEITFEQSIPGTGGGAVLIKLQESNCVLLGCHLAFKSFYIENHKIELDELYKRLKEEYLQIIFAGDFNRDHTFYKQTTFGSEMKSTQTQRTFPSFFPFYKPLSLLSENIISGTIDSVYITHSITIKDSYTVTSRSDHRMLFTKLLL